jgi:hypothetical protein
MINKEYLEGVDFKFVIPEEVSDNIDIKLLAGEYAGVVYRYGGVSIDEDPNNPVLSFNYDIIDNNGNDDLESEDDFKNHIGNILVSLIEQRLKSETEEV